MTLEDHLFRRDSGRIIAAVSRLLGPQSLAVAEDVAQDAFCRALEVWPLRGIPDNPSAWLMLTAKNRALDFLRRQRTAHTFAPELAAMLESEQTLAAAVDNLFSPSEMKDDLLRMMFSCADPRLPEQTQAALILQVLCGFAVDEVANAFMSGHHAMEKRLVRAKKVLATSEALFDVSSEPDLEDRLPVQRALYQLFNEGYHGGSPKAAVREELCHEAVRLTAILAADVRCATPSTYALGALMCLHAARLSGRTTANADELVPFGSQERRLWDRVLIREGLQLLELAAEGPDLTSYHLEAMIAAVHCSASNSGETDWTAIVELYDQLLAVAPSPVVALSRAVAIGQRDGPESGLAELRKIANEDKLVRYPFYFAALGEFESVLGQLEAASASFDHALSLARSPMERQFYKRRLDGLERRESAAWA